MSSTSVSHEKKKRRRRSVSADSSDERNAGGVRKSRDNKKRGRRDNSSDDSDSGREKGRDRDRDRSNKKKVKRNRRSRSRSKSPQRREQRRRSRERPRRRSRSRERRDRSRSHSAKRKSRDNRGSSPSPQRPTKKDKQRDKPVVQIVSAVVSKMKRKPVAEPSNETLMTDSTSLTRDAEKEAEQKQLEEEMRKRRERVEAWRAARRTTEQGESSHASEQNEGENGENDEQPQKKGWTLDDDEDDDEANGLPLEDEEQQKETEEAMEMEEDVDPLDAFMAGMKNNQAIHDRSKKKSANSTESQTVKATVITATRQTTNSAVLKSTRGELMEANPDAMEYSSEEETTDLAVTIASLGPKPKKKELPVVDHTKVQYHTFRKKFYVEVPELTKLTDEEVNVMRENSENISIKGKNCPKPIKSFAQSGVSSKVLDVLRKNNYEKPTPIQMQAIPAIMSGQDLIGIAKTGSGKTLAFLLPMFRHVLDQPQIESGEGPIALIMAPTRELAIQIYNECRKFCKVLKLRAVCVYGGTGISEQIADLKRGGEIIVCTPGRMIDMLAANNGRVTNTRRTTYLVLDEADRMFDLGFEPQHDNSRESLNTSENITSAKMTAEVTRIVQMCRPDRQTVMFSATFPRQMETLARKVLTKPVEVQVGGRSVVCKDVEQSVVIIEESLKFKKLLELLGIYQEQGSVLVFVEKQDAADILLKELIRHGYPCLSLHGGMDQFDRDSTISDFKNAVTKLLVATSVAARGLDIRHLILVVNYDCPNHYEDYVHRCGRTGRAGNKGYSYTFLTPEQGRYACDIIRALEQSGTPVPAELEELWQDFAGQQEAMGIKVSKEQSKGFSGKGYKFDEKEEVKKNEERKLQKSALGLQDSDDEAEEAEELEKKLETIFSNKPKKVELGNFVLPSALQPQITVSKSAAMKKVAAIAGKLSKKLSSVPGEDNMDVEFTESQQAVSRVMKGESVNAVVSGATLAAQIAAGINARGGFQKANPQSLPMTPSQVAEQASTEQTLSEKWEDEVEINDLPQNVRWKITSKDATETVGEYSECGITVRGMYFPLGKKVSESDKKLYLYIEGPTERSVNLAKIEIRRLIVEEIAKQASRPKQRTGRYTVL